MEHDNLGKDDWRRLEGQHNTVTSFQQIQAFPGISSEFSNDSKPIFAAFGVIAHDTIMMSWMCTMKRHSFFAIYSLDASKEASG